MKILLVIYFLATTAFAQDLVGEVILVKGQVYKSTRGIQKEVKVGTRFFQNDTLKTQDKAFVKIQVVDDTIITLGPRSELNFEEFKFTSKTDRNMVISFIKGQLSAHIKTKAKDGDVSVKTKSAVMGIRGTQILVNHQTLSNKEVSEFALLSGQAQVTDNKHQSYDLMKTDKLTIISDSVTKQIQNVQEQMIDEEFKFLSAEGTDETKEFKPFMPYFDLNSNRTSTPRSSKPSTVVVKKKPEVTNDTLTRNETIVQDDEGSDSHPEWKSNLQKLNEQLKKNQQSR